MLRRLCNYLAISVVCIALWRCGVAGPVGERAVPLRITGAECSSMARSLFWNITEVLAMEHLFSGFDCSQQSAEVRLRTQTVSACTPQNSSCAYSTILNIDESKCLQSILEDLQFYRETFQAYSNPDLTKTAVKSIDDLLQTCFSVPAMDRSPEKVSVDQQKSFQERLQLCKVMKGFSLRTVTINRVFNYILSK